MRDKVKFPRWFDFPPNRFSQIRFRIRFKLDIFSRVLCAMFTSRRVQIHDRQMCVQQMTDKFSRYHFRRTKKHCARSYASCTPLRKSHHDNLFEHVEQPDGRGDFNHVLDTRSDRPHFPNRQIHIERGWTRVSSPPGFSFQSSIREPSSFSILSGVGPTRRRRADPPNGDLPSRRDNTWNRLLGEKLAKLPRRSVVVEHFGSVDRRFEKKEKHCFPHAQLISDTSRVSTATDLIDSILDVCMSNTFVSDLRSTEGVDSLIQGDIFKEQDYRRCSRDAFIPRTWAALCSRQCWTITSARSRVRYIGVKGTCWSSPVRISR